MSLLSLLNSHGRGTSTSLPPATPPAKPYPPPSSSSHAHFAQFRKPSISTDVSSLQVLHHPSPTPPGVLGPVPSNLRKKNLFTPSLPRVICSTSTKEKVNEPWTFIDDIESRYYSNLFFKIILIVSNRHSRARLFLYVILFLESAT